MRKSMIAAVAVLAAGLLTGCGSLNSVLNNQKQTVEMYHVLDIKTAEAPETISDAIVAGLSRNTNSITQNSPLQMGVQIPNEPGRFKLVNPLAAFEGTPFGSLVNQANGAAGTTPVRIAVCEDAVWSAKARRTIAGSDNLNIYTCLYQYKGGYQLNIYAVFQKISGGLEQIARNAAHSLVGTPEEWVTTTISDTFKGIQATNSSLTYLEGKPVLPNLTELNIPRAPLASK